MKRKHCEGPMEEPIERRWMDEVSDPILGLILEMLTNLTVPWFEQAEESIANLWRDPSLVCKRWNPRRWVSCIWMGTSLVSLPLIQQYVHSFSKLKTLKLAMSRAPQKV